MALHKGQGSRKELARGVSQGKEVSERIAHVSAEARSGMVVCSGHNPIFTSVRSEKWTEAVEAGRWKLGCGEPSMLGQENGSGDAETLKDSNCRGTYSFIFIHSHFRLVEKDHFCYDLLKNE